jgi:hypothetical protein
VVVWQSTDGASFQIAAVAAAPSVIGETLDPLPAGPTARWDHANAFRVRLYGGVLTSLSDARVLGGGNVAGVQNAEGAWEIIQFAGAELVDGNTYRLSRLLRGQGGSEPAMATLLPAGAPFVLFDKTLLPIARGLDAMDRSLSLRVVGNGRSHDDVSAVSVTVTPDRTALLPLAPVHLRAMRQPDGIHITWIRRTRIDGDGWNAEVPLGEGSESYRLEILSGAAVVRSIACTTSQALYAAADELADFGAPQPRLHLRVAQISGTVGAGWATECMLSI